MYDNVKAGIRCHTLPIGSHCTAQYMFFFSGGPLYRKTMSSAKSMSILTGPTKAQRKFILPQLGNGKPMNTFIM